jgi:hypothetical protein
MTKFSVIIPSAHMYDNGIVVVVNNVMPPFSARKKNLRYCKSLLAFRLQLAECRQLMGISSVEEDNLDVLVLLIYLVMMRNRYHEPRLCRKFPTISYYGSQSEIQDVFTDLSSGYRNWLNEREFQSKYRVPMAAFLPILDMIKKTPVFLDFNNSSRRGPKMRSVALQLGVFLYYIGSEGDGGSSN